VHIHYSFEPDHDLTRVARWLVLEIRMPLLFRLLRRAIIAAFDKENVRTMAAVKAYAEAHPTTRNLRRAAMLMAIDFYRDPARGAVAGWPNRFAVMAWPEWLRFDPIAMAPRIRVPTLIVHSEDAAIPELPGGVRHGAIHSGRHRALLVVEVVLDAVRQGPAASTTV
jgi:pimeloyl-ACP methyl ester carboxylesterase